MRPPELSTIYKQQARYVFRTLQRLGVRAADVDDLAQEVFTVVFERLADYEHDRAIEPWLFGIAFRVASVHHRTRSRRIVEVSSDPIEVPDDAAPGPEEGVADRQARQLVMQALEALTLDQRAVLVMHDIDGQPVPAIAATLDLPVNTVYSRLRVARARFTARVRFLRLRSGDGGMP